MLTPPVSEGARYAQATHTMDRNHQLALSSYNLTLKEVELLILVGLGGQAGQFFEAGSKPLLQEWERVS